VLFAVTSGVVSPAPVRAASGETYTAAERRHWSFRPRSPVALPSFDSAEDRAWAAQPIDRFVLGRLKQEGLRPAPPANRHTLIRRVYFDLSGLPLAPDVVEQFVNDKSASAWSKVVDRLLDSPEYAERAA
jgi:hypothetical protein